MLAAPQAGWFTIMSDYGGTWLLGLGTGLFALAFELEGAHRPQSSHAVRGGVAACVKAPAGAQPSRWRSRS